MRAGRDWDMPALLTPLERVEILDDDGDLIDVLKAGEDGVFTQIAADHEYVRAARARGVRFRVAVPEGENRARTRVTDEPVGLRESSHAVDLVHVRPARERTPATWTATAVRAGDPLARETDLSRADDEARGRFVEQLGRSGPGPIPTIGAPSIVRAGVSPFTVTLMGTALHDLRLIALEARDGCEAGGLLIGSRPNTWERTIPVWSVVDGGPRAQRTRTSFKHDPEWRQAHDASADDPRARDSVVIGQWHTHDLTVGRRGPSRDDLAGWATELELVDRSGRGAVLVGLIVSSRDGSFIGADLDAFALHYDESVYRRIVAERARLVIRES